VAVLPALALLDAQQHTLAFDIGDLEVGDLGHAQAGAIRDAERGLVLDTRCRLQKLCHLFLAEHDPQLLRQGYEGEMATQLGMVEGYPEEKPQRSDRAVHGRRRDAFLALMHLIPAQVFSHCCGRRAAEKR
jgi:hypothetical protein